MTSDPCDPDGAGSSAPAPGVRTDDDGRICLDGEWTLPHLAALEPRIESIRAETRELDATGITRLDASGAWLLGRLVDRIGLDDGAVALDADRRPLYRTVRAAMQADPALPERGGSQWRRLLEQIGQAVVGLAGTAVQLTGFLGLTLHRLARTVLHPRRLRLTSVVYHMEQTGLDAVPLLALLSGLIGAVVAYLGATVLRDFGAEILVVDLVTFAFLREFGVLLTAILLAGRTASAFCAQIGMMKTREEVDAIRTLGLDEIELLVLPRLLALLVMLPLLAFIATIAGLFGGFVVSVLALGIGADLFIDRVSQTLALQHYLVGLIKAPLFALVIALIGCNEGLKVAGTAQSVGEHTTSAVVQSLTLVIVLDALAAIYFMEIGW